MISKIKITAAIFLMAIGAYAQNILTLEEAVNIALENNVTVLTAKNNYEMASNSVHIGNAGFLPRIDLSVSAIYNDNYYNVFGGKSYDAYTTNIATIKASYILFNGMRNFALFSKLKYSSQAAKFRSKATAENVALSVIQTYNQIVLLDEKLQIAKESMEISRERMFRQKTKEEFGQNGNIDYLSAVVDFNKDSLNYIYVNTQLQQAKQNLNKLLNREINLEFKIEKEVNYKDIPSENELLQLAKKNNSEYIAAEKHVEISREEKRIAGSSYYPLLSIESAYGYNTMPDEFEIDFSDPNKTFYAGLNLQYNIFNGFQYEIQAQNAEIEMRNSQLALRQTELNLVTEISNAYVAYQNAKTALELEQTSLETAKLNFERMKEMYELGKVTLTQFREAQLKLISAKNRISELKFLIKNNEASLLKLAGILLPE